MKLVLILLAVAGLCASPRVLRADQPESGKSPGGHISYEIRPAGDGKEVWVWRDDEKGRANKMCDTVGTRLKLCFSPDDRWIIVQDGTGSLGVSLRLFHREGEHTYEERDKENIDDKAELAALKTENPAATEVADHRYAECLDWSTDSSCILVRISGKGFEGQTNNVQFHWLCVYDLTTGKISTDLGKLNKGGVRRWPRGSEIGNPPMIGAQ